MFIPDVTLRNQCNIFSQSLAKSSDLSAFFPAHRGGLTLADALGGLWHKQDSKPILRITQYVVVCCFRASNMTTICRFFNPDYSESFSACAATHHAVFSPQKYCTSKVESGINKGYSALQITTRLPLTSWARIPFASAIRHKQIGFIFTANKKAHLVTFPCCLWIKQVGK